MKKTLLALALLGCAAAQAAGISDAEKATASELAKNNGCLSCHALHEKIVGPAYASVAEKYKGQDDAVASLVQSVQYGSKGKWGRIPMPPHPSLSQDDMKLLVRWVLSTPK